MESIAKKPGPPRRLTYQITAKILELTEAGKTVAQIADIVSIPERTLYYWFKTDQTLLQSIKEARQVADDMVEASLFRRAIGYSHPEVKHFAHEGVVVDEKIVEKHYPPDPTSAIFWLKNRRPKRWRDRIEVEQKTTIQGEIDCGPFKLKKPSDEA